MFLSDTYIHSVSILPYLSRQFLFLVSDSTLVYLKKKKQLLFDKHEWKKSGCSDRSRHCASRLCLRGRKRHVLGFAATAEQARSLHYKRAAKGIFSKFC